MKNTKLLIRLCQLCLILGVLSGCKTSTKTPKTYTFFPPAPDEPRIQFLTSFATDRELGRTRSFSDYVIGEDKSVNPLVKPYGLAIHDGKIYVCDTVADIVQVFDLRKKRASVFEPRGEGKLRLPINITIDQDGTRYVADTGRQQVLIYANDGTFLEAMGIKDEMKPTDVAITTNRLYITDLIGRAVRVYNKTDRKLLFTIPVNSGTNNSGTNAGKLFQPTNLTVDKSGNRLLVSDTGGNVVQIYDLDGNYLRSIGRQGVAPGMFARPKGIAVDRHGLTYVVDAATQVVQIFDNEGRLLLFFGEVGASTRGEVILPAAVEVDYDNVSYFQKYVAPDHQCEYLILVTSQFGAQKVSVYGFLKSK